MDKSEHYYQNTLTILKMLLKILTKYVLLKKTAKVQSTEVLAGVDLMLNIINF